MKLDSRIFKFINIIVLLAFMQSCADNNQINAKQDNPLDYTSVDLWYNGLPATNYDVDVFYVLPTCVWDWTDDAGKLHNYADVYNTEQRKAMKYSYNLAQKIFADDFANYYAPYYRQTTLNSWIAGEQISNERFVYAMADVRNAFNYYLKYKNGNKPFVLAGFSQGGKAVVELLKELDTATRARLVAAYVIGYKITSEDLAKYPQITPATDDTSTGVAICYNSVETTESMAPILSPSAICINPVNWRTDETECALNDTVTVKVDNTAHVLIVKGLDSEKYFHQSLEALFKKGNYHLQELSLYEDLLQQNVKLRIKTFKTNNR